MTNVLIHLVHGTQFYVRRKPLVPWVDVDGAADAGDSGSFRQGVRERLAARGHVADFDVVAWSGRNRYGARLEAAQELRAHALSPAPEGVRHFVVAHSHGGNASWMALQRDDGALERRLSGIVCLSTPFLVVREEAWAKAATIAWMCLVLIGPTLIWGWRTSNPLLAIGAGALLLGIVSTLLLVALRSSRAAVHRQFGATSAGQPPMHSAVPFLIVRCPGDEASSGLGLVAILAKLLYQLERLSAWPLDLLRRHPVRLWIGSMLVLLALAIAASTLPPVRDVLLASRWWILGMLLAPWLLGLPARLIVYGLAYGLDLFGLPLLHSISAEATPLGRWETHLVETSDTEDRRAAHSEPYKLAGVQQLVADWIADRLAAPNARPLASAQTADV